MPREEAIEVESKVVEILSDNKYRVEMANGHQLVAYVSAGKRLQFSGLTLGSVVTVRVSPFDFSKGSICIEKK